MTTTKQLKKYQACYNHFYSELDCDLIEVPYHKLTDRLKAELIVWRKRISSGTHNDRFALRIRSYALQNEWRSLLKKSYDAKLDFSEYENWPIYHKSQVGAYLGISRDIKVGTATIFVENKTAFVSVTITGDIFEEYQAVIKSCEIGLGFIEAPGPSIKILDVYFN